MKNNKIKIAEWTTSDLSPGQEYGGNYYYRITTTAASGILLGGHVIDGDNALISFKKVDDSTMIMAFATNNKCTYLFYYI